MCVAVVLLRLPPCGLPSDELLAGRCSSDRVTAGGLRSGCVGLAQSVRRTRQRRRRIREGPPARLGGAASRTVSCLARIRQGSQCRWCRCRRLGPLIRRRRSIWPCGREQPRRWPARLRSPALGPNRLHPRRAGFRRPHVAIRAGARSCSARWSIDSRPAAHVSGAGPVRSRRRAPRHSRVAVALRVGIDADLDETGGPQPFP